MEGERKRMQVSTGAPQRWKRQDTVGHRRRGKADGETAGSEARRCHCCLSSRRVWRRRGRHRCRCHPKDSPPLGCHRATTASSPTIGPPPAPFAASTPFAATAPPLPPDLAEGRAPLPRRFPSRHLAASPPTATPPSPHVRERERAR